MRAGEVVATRFELEALAGSGGMGNVYRALDRATGEIVALKVLVRDPLAHATRFAHEARALAELSHPHVVRYVAHGVADTGEPYLAMEWLEGEDLTARLARRGLSTAESLGLVSRVAGALAAAHALGIVHRDLKPSNVFLVKGQLEGAKVIDFGIARLMDMTRVTRTGMLVGTPGYIAPEQAQSSHVVDARADVFSLGCVLFECLTGVPAFAGGHLMAVLAKVLFSEPPRLSELWPEAPPALERLVSRMLAKQPDERLRDGAAVVEALAELGSASTRRVTGYPAAALTEGERRTMSVVLTMGKPEPWTTDATLALGEAGAVEALRRGAEAFGGRLDRLADGSVVVSIGGAGLPTDEAAQAARCALWLQGRVGGHALALATGYEEVAGCSAASSVIDRAAALLVRPTAAATVTVAGWPADSWPVAIDETTARLLDGRFDVREGDTGSLLFGERELEQGSRLLLNKPTTCVGRDRELSMLAQMFAECVDEPQAQAALVTGGAGIGKSRLLHELLARLRQRGEPFSVWFGRGDVLRAGTAFGLIGQAIRGACGIRGDESPGERHDKLATRMRQCLGASQARRAVELLGELVGVTLTDRGSDLLRAARTNAQIMTDELRRVFIEFLAAECEARPVLLVLENLHWGDLPSVQLIDGALRELGEQPWMVLALARPEVHELFPRLWTARRMQELKLRQLSRKASERLVRQVLGDELDTATLERIVVQADGHAFYLEELIRAAAERRAYDLPQTVVAMVQARLAALPDEDRRALRAAAVFGEACWPGAVAALLGHEDEVARVERRLLGLVEQEVLVRRSESRFGGAGHMELAFRHLLLREGAYAMLTDDDRVLGHRLAGEWLEQAGERDAKLLAVHFDRGGEPARAAGHYLRAAEHGLEAGNYPQVLELTERAIAVAQHTEWLAGLRSVEGEARLHCGDLRGGLDAAVAALAVARPGSRTECRAIYAGAMSAAYLRDHAFLEQTMDKLLTTEPEPDALPLLASAFFSVINSFIGTVQRDRVEQHLRRLEQVTASAMDRDPITAAWVELSRSMWSLHVERDSWGMLAHTRRAEAHYRRSGAAGTLPFAQFRIGVAHVHLGLFELAEQEFARASGEAGSIKMGRAFMRLEQQRCDEALALAASLLRDVEEHRNQHLYWIGRICTMEALFDRGDVEAADAYSVPLGEEIEEEPYTGLWYLTVRACIRLAQGRTEEALALAEQALGRSRESGMGYCIRHAKLLLVRAEALHALGDRDAARQAILEAENDLMRRAARIPDAEVRRSFLDNIRDHHRTSMLARQWLGERAEAHG